MFQSDSFPPFWNWILNLLFWTGFRKVNCQKSRRLGILLKTLIKFQRDLISPVEILRSSRFHYDIVPKYVNFKKNVLCTIIGWQIFRYFLVQLKKYETTDILSSVLWIWMVWIGITWKNEISICFSDLTQFSNGHQSERRIVF